MMTIVMIVFLAFVLGVLLGIGLIAAAVEPTVTRVSDLLSSEDRT